MTDTIELGTVGSTNDWLAARARELSDDSWVRADVQTAGRGRTGRQWLSVPGNLFASALVKPRPGEGPPAQLSLVAALALAEAVIPWRGRAHLSLKWPNDVLLGGAKLAGILLDQTEHGTVIGFGVNITGYPAGLDQRVTALADHAEHSPSPQTLLAELRAAFVHWRARWRDEGFAPVRLAWLTRGIPVGWRLGVRMGAELRRGEFAGLAPDGALLLRRDGAIETIHAGDVL